MVSFYTLPRPVYDLKFDTGETSEEAGSRK